MLVRLFRKLHKKSNISRSLFNYFFQFLKVRRKRSSFLLLRISQAYVQRQQKRTKQNLLKDETNRSQTTGHLTESIVICKGGVLFVID